MLEFFTISYYTDNLNNLKEKENIKMNYLLNNKEISSSLTRKNINVEALNLIIGIIVLFLSLWSSNLAWNLADKCKIKKDGVSEVTVVLFSFFFPVFYLIYYFVWHTLLGNKC